MSLLSAVHAHLPSNLYVKIAAGVIGSSVFLFAANKLRTTGRSNRDVYITNYEEDKIYLFQFPSCSYIVNISPFAMKVECFLRLHKLKYEVISSAGRWSKKGQIPFIEVNGQQMADSNMILDFLKDKFDIPESTSQEQKGIIRAFGMMLDNQTTWSTFYYRYVKEAKEFVSTWQFMNKITQFIMGFQFPRGFHKRAREHGIGRHSLEEIVNIACKDWKAISNYLGENAFMLGDQPTELDCYVFPHLSQIIDIPVVNYPHRDFIKAQCPNLIQYHHRVKETLWPDWDDQCRANLYHKKI